MVGKVFFPIFGSQSEKKQNRDGHSAVFVVVILHKALYVRAVCVFFVFDDGFPEHIAGSVGIGVVYGADIALIVKLISPDGKNMRADGVPFSDGNEFPRFAGIYNKFIEISAVQISAPSRVGQSGGLLKDIFKNTAFTFCRFLHRT